MKDVDFFWNDAGLKSATNVGFVRSVKDAQAVAQAKNPAKGHIRISVPKLDPSGFALLKGLGPLAHLFEEGVKRHSIPVGKAKVERFSRRGTSVRKKRGGKQALKGASYEHPIKRAVEHPGMIAKPYMAPAAQAWAGYLYQRAASAAFTSAGYRRFG
jgi:hypothetical protein